MVAVHGLVVGERCFMEVYAVGGLLKLILPTRMPPIVLVLFTSKRE